MKSLLTVLLFFCMGDVLGQTLINGDFEINSAGGQNRTSLSHALFNGYMPDCNSFGTQPNLDIITTAEFDGGPQNGNWMVGLTGGGTDWLAMTLTAPLVAGKSYRFSFYDKTLFNNTTATPIVVGLSATNNQGGTILYTSPAPATPGIWTRREFGFIAPHAGQYITVRHQGGFSNWVQVDNFSCIPCPDSIRLGNDTSLCAGEVLQLDATLPGADYLWQDNSTDPTFTVNQAGTYWVRVQNGYCIYADTIVVTFDTLPALQLGSVISRCEGDSVLLQATTPQASYLWSDFSTDSTLLVTQPGTYWVAVTRNNCIIRDTVELIFLPFPVVDLGPDTTLCDDKSLNWDVFIPQASYLWHDNSTAAVFTATRAGTYWVTVTLNNCSVTDSVTLEPLHCRCEIYVPNAFSPNDDQLNDVFGPQFNCTVSAYQLLVYNRWGEQVFESSDPFKSWNGNQGNAPAAPGYYTYLIRYTDSSQEAKQTYGQVRLLR